MEAGIPVYYLCGVSVKRGEREPFFSSYYYGVLRFVVERKRNHRTPLFSSLSFVRFSFVNVSRLLSLRMSPSYQTRTRSPPRYIHSPRNTGSSGGEKHMTPDICGGFFNTLVWSSRRLSWCEFVVVVGVNVCVYVINFRFFFFC